jgi:hypothetical protein
MTRRSIKEVHCLACKDKGDASPYCWYCKMPYKGKMNVQVSEAIRNDTEIDRQKHVKRCKTCSRELVIKKSGDKTEYLCPKITEAWVVDYSETHTNYAIYDNGMMFNYSTACEPY